MFRGVVFSFPRRRLALFVGIVWVVARAGAEAVEIAWHVGFAARNITPDERLMLAGCVSRAVPASKVVDDLYFKVLAYEDASRPRQRWLSAYCNGTSRYLSSTRVGMRRRL